MRDVDTIAEYSLERTLSSINICSINRVQSGSSLTLCFQMYNSFLFSFLNYSSQYIGVPWTSLGKITFQNLTVRQWMIKKHDLLHFFFSFWEIIKFVKLDFLGVPHLITTGKRNKQEDLSLPVTSNPLSWILMISWSSDNLSFSVLRPLDGFSRQFIDLSVSGMPLEKFLRSFPCPILWTLLILRKFLKFCLVFS